MTPTERRRALDVYTARVSYRGPDRLDVTRKSGCATGIVFAPSWALLRPYLARRASDALTDADWTAYVAAYTAEMRASYRAERATWDALLARAEVTLCCYCVDPTHCHRTVLAQLFVRLGAEYRGER